MYNFRFTGIHHIALVTGDMDTTIRFWRDLLGLRMTLATGGDGRRLYFFQVAENDFLSFFEWPGIEKAEYKVPGVPVSGSFHYDHVSLSVATEDELWNLADRFIAGGFFVSNVMDHGFLKAFYSFDPNGIPLEFCVENKEIDVRKTPLMLDPFATEIANEGPEPDYSRWPRTEPRSMDERIILPGRGRSWFVTPKKKEEEG